MTISPQDLLKKLKPTPSFAVDKESIITLARLAIELGEGGFADVWEALFAKKPSARATTAKKAVQPKSPKAPELLEAESLLKGFSSSRGVKSAELALAFVRYVRGIHTEVGEPTKSATASMVSAVKWISERVRQEGVNDLAKSFVDRFSADTDYTYR